MNYFCWTNPKMENGGLIGYSKSKMLSQIPSEFVPETRIIEKGMSFASLEALFIKENIKFPLIAKPDQGARGYRVEFVTHMNQMKTYHQSAKATYLIQEFIDSDMEFGVFVVKTKDKFYLSSFTKKEFLSLVGDGKSNLEALFLKNERALKYFNKEQLPSYRERILLQGEKMLLEPIGNHIRGTKFINAQEFIDEELTSVFEKVVHQIKDFNYGRFDIKAVSIEELKQSKFKVMELNGISAEPAHIYDPQLSLKKAYKDLLWHWRMMAQIASENRKKGFRKESFLTTLRSLLDYYKNR